MEDATLKDLAFKFCSSRKVHEVDRRVCLNPFMGELRSRREERNLNGVKNLLGARPFPNTLSEQSTIWRYFSREGGETYAFNLITEELQGHMPKRLGSKTLFILIIIYYF